MSDTVRRCLLAMLLLSAWADWQPRGTHATATPARRAGLISLGYRRQLLETIEASRRVSLCPELRTAPSRVPALAPASPSLVLRTDPDRLYLLMSLQL